jgi:hypothetical protein
MFGSAIPVVHDFESDCGSLSTQVRRFRPYSPGIRRAPHFANALLNGFCNLRSVLGS